METCNSPQISHSIAIVLFVHFHLTRLGGNLGGSTLCTLLALNTLGLALGGAGSGLGLLSFLAALRSGLLVLGVLDSLLAGGGTSFRALASSLLDHIKGSTDNGTLGLDNTASALLRDFLIIARRPVSSCSCNLGSLAFPRIFSSRLSTRNRHTDHIHLDPQKSKQKGCTDFGDTLPVLTAKENGPGYPARVLALEEKGLGLSILEAEDLAVATDVQLTLYYAKTINH
jgi:hypothetical protein